MPGPWPRLGRPVKHEVGNGGPYRYYTCPIKARQGETGCKGRSISMEKLDALVADHIEDRLLQPERLEEILASAPDRRQERTERRREHIAELTKRAAETGRRLERVYDAIENGVADLDDPALKDRIAGLKSIRDQAQADADRALAMAESAGQQAITPAMVQLLARTARERVRIDGGGYGRAVTSARLHNVWKSRTATSASWDRKAICSEPSPPCQA